MSDLLAIAASGVRATRGALDATAQNIANANTEGFVRRSAVLREVAGASMGGGQGTPAGVRLAGLQRGSDEFRAADLRRANGDVARGGAQVAGLEAIEAALSARAVGPAFTGFFDAALTLSADPGSTPGRAELLARADVVADAVRGAAGDLVNAGEDTRRSLDLDAGALTRSAAALARVNDQPSLGNKPWSNQNRRFSTNLVELVPCCREIVQVSSRRKPKKIVTQLS